MRRAQTKQRKWWKTAQDSILTMAGYFASMPVALYIHKYLTSWAVLLAWLALIASIFAGAGFFRQWVPRWLARTSAMFCFALFFFLSFVQDWVALPLTATNLLGFGLFMGSVELIWVLVRRRRHVNRRAATLSLNMDAGLQPYLLFRDDGERIVVYADKRQLLNVLVALIILTPALVVVFLRGGTNYLADFSNLLLLLVLVLLLGFAALSMALTLTLLMRAAPTLVVGPDGLLDDASLFITGRGLLRWDEVVSVQQLVRNLSSGGVDQLLSIEIADAVAVHRRQALWKRLLDYAFRTTPPVTLNVARLFLDRSPDALANEIRRYVASHAPSGWHSPLIDNVKADAETDQSQAI